MARVFLGLGSNVDASANFRLAIDELRRRFGQLDLSPVYQSRAAGFDGDDFLNMVVGMTTTDSPQQVHDQIEAIHELAGRRRGPDKYAPRELDIDILLFDSLVDPDGCPRLPRRDILEYAFVLRPMAELAPNAIHPETGRSMAEHWRAFDASSHPLTPVRVIL